MDVLDELRQMVDARNIFIYQSKLIRAIAEIERLRAVEAHSRKLQDHILADHQRALPANWVFTDCDTTLDLMVAEIITLRHELKALEAARTELAKELAETLREMAAYEEAK